MGCEPHQGAARETTRFPTRAAAPDSTAPAAAAQSCLLLPPAEQQGPRGNGLCGCSSSDEEGRARRSEATVARRITHWSRTGSRARAVARCELAHTRRIAATRVAFFFVA
jgi:hypothetical protein